MSGLRPGVPAARALWRSTDAGRWSRALDQYSAVVKAMVPPKPSKTMKNLVGDDRWMMEQLPALLRARCFAAKDGEEEVEGGAGREAAAGT